MEQEQEAHQRDHRELLQQLVAQMQDRALDQARAVVGLDDLHARRQAAFQRGELGLHRLDGGQRVLARAHDDHAARHFAFAIEFRDAAAHLRPDLDARHVAQLHRNATVGGRQRDCPEVVERLQVPGGAHHVLGFTEFEHRAATLAVGLLHGVDHAVVRDAVGAQLVREEDDLVLAHHAADRGHFGHVRHGLQLVLQEPILQRAEFAQVMPAAAVHQRVLVDPAHAGGVGPQGRLRCGRQARLHLREVLEHPRACPVRVGAVLEQDVDERIAEERVATHGLCARHRHHGGGERVGHLVFHDARGLPGKGRADDDLHVRQVRQGVQGRAQRGPGAPRGDQCSRDEHEETVGHRPADQRGNHGLALRASFSTTKSPSLFGTPRISNSTVSPAFTPSRSFLSATAKPICITPHCMDGIGSCLSSR